MVCDVPLGNLNSIFEIPYENRNRKAKKKII